MNPYQPPVRFSQEYRRAEFRANLRETLIIWALGLILGLCLIGIPLAVKHPEVFAKLLQAFAS